MKQLLQPSVATGVPGALLLIGLTLVALTTSSTASADERRYGSHDSHRYNQPYSGHNKHQQQHKQYYSNKHQNHQSKHYYSNPGHGSYKGTYNGQGFHHNQHGLHKTPQWHSKHHDHRRYDHDFRRDRHTSHNGFSLNFWGFVPLVPHYRSYPSLSASYHYHNNNQRCYSRH